MSGHSRLARIRSAILVAGAVVGGWPLLAQAAEPPSQFRSVTDVRPRIPDEHDRPYFRETQSHRGFEVRDEHYTVIATTSREDARWAASQVAATWRNAAALAERWTDLPRQPDFGLQTLQIVIDDEPLRERDAPLTTVNVVGIQTQIQLNVGPGRPPLAEQLVPLREATAFALLHMAGLDSAAPPWVVAGLASLAGRQGLTEAELKTAASGQVGTEFGGQQWRFLRKSEDVLDYRRLNHDEAAQRIAFLLTGDDAAHAPALLAALQGAMSRAETAAAAGSGFDSFPGGERRPAADTTFDRLIGDLGARYDAWKVNPLAGQPVLEPAAGASPDEVAAQREMLVLLKLQRRFATAAADDSRTAPKIIAFDRQRGAQAQPAVLSPAVDSFATLAARLSDPFQPVWATLDADRSLLLSTDRQRLSQLLGTGRQENTIRQEANRVVLVRRLDLHRELKGWLEDNPNDPSRPLAKFEVVDSRTR